MGLLAFPRSFSSAEHPSGVGFQPAQAELTQSSVLDTMFAVEAIGRNLDHNEKRKSSANRIKHLRKILTPAV